MFRALWTSASRLGDSPDKGFLEQLQDGVLRFIISPTPKSAAVSERRM